MSCNNMCKLNKNRKWRKEYERDIKEVVVMLCVVVFLVNHLDNKTLSSMCMIVANFTCDTKCQLLQTLFFSNMA